MVRVYLSHSPREKERGIKVQKILEDIGYEVLNPFSLNLDIDEFHWSDLSEIRVKDSIKLCKAEINNLLDSDIVLALYPKDMVSIGIPCEIAIAHDYRKTVITVIDPKFKGHPWIVYMSSIIIERDELIEEVFRTMLEEIEYLEPLNIPSKLLS